MVCQKSYSVTSGDNFLLFKLFFSSFFGRLLSTYGIGEVGVGGAEGFGMQLCRGEGGGGVTSGFDNCCQMWAAEKKKKRRV